MRPSNHGVDLGQLKAAIDRALENFDSNGFSERDLERIKALSERQFYDYIQEKVRPIDGIHDTLCEIWEISHVFGKDEDFVSGWTSMACM